MNTSPVGAGSFQVQHEQPVAYMVCEPASHYYAVMTRSKRMPLLIGERI